MDPNETLAQIREAIEELEGLSEDNFVDALIQADRLAEHFQALDEWLTRDGFLPEDWKRDTCAACGGPMHTPQAGCVRPRPADRP